MIFVDTSAWFAIYFSRDANHPRAIRIASQLQFPPVTTDYVVDETLTLLRTKGEDSRALAFGNRIFHECEIRLELIAAKDILQAWELFQRFADKGWSFTDCTSFAVMERMQIRRAFAFDRHFRQLGSIEVLELPDGD